MRNSTELRRSLAWLIIFAGWCTTAWAQTNVTGRVLEAANQAGLPGVSVLLKGTSRGTITDSEGNYSLTLPNGSNNGTLVFSFIGYASQEVPINGQSAINVSMSADAKSLNEVVVVGYGTQIKREVTGSVGTLDARQLEDQPVGQFAQRIQGRIAGVQINQGTGRPGAGLSFRIRGAASINAGNGPLFVVDGFPIVGDISNINPDEIETFSVLKDASASSLYGSRAANGVVLITTKQAKPGKTQIQFNANYGIQRVPQQGRPNVMNGTEFAQFKKEFYEDAARYEDYTDGVPAEFQNPAQYGEGTNWYDILLRQNAPISNYSLSIATSKERFSSSIVAGYFKQDGVVLNSGYERYSLRANNEFRVNDFIRIGANVAPTYQVNNNFNPDGIFNITSAALTAPPTSPAINPDGTLPIRISAPGMFTTPNWYRAIQERQNLRKATRLLSSAYAEVNFLKNFSFKTSINIDLEGRSDNIFTPSTAGGGVFQAPPVQATGLYGTRFYYSWLTENTLTYNHSFKDHNVEAFVGYSAQKYREENNTLTGTDFPDDAVSWLDAAATRNGSNNVTEWSLLSLIGRVNYNYKGKYLFSAAVRRDGSSRFGTNNRWGTFPSISAGWVISDENFGKVLGPVSFLKLRASYGLTGNFNIGNYNQYANIGSTNYVFGGALSQGRAPTSLGNPDLTWETTGQFDVGIDAGLFNDRISFTADYYNKRTNDLLYQVDIPRASGFFNVQSNVGEFKFWGYEFAVNSRNLVGDLKWTTDFNISFNRTKAVQLGTNNTAIGGYNDYGDYWRTAIGQPIGQFYGYVFDGVFRTQGEFDAGPKHATSEIGTVRYRDLNGDGIINSQDRSYLGNPTPKFVFGFVNSLSYKNFDLNVVVSGAYGGDLLNAQLELTENLDGVFNVARYVKDRWRSPEQPGNGIIPRTKAGTTAIQRATNSRWIEDGSYATIKNITLGYTLPIPTNKYLNRARIYASIQQALVLTNYSGLNPEVSNSGLDGLRQGLDAANYPVPRTLALGANLTF